LVAVLFKIKQEDGQGIGEPSFKIAWQELPKKLRKSEHLATDASNNKHEGIYRHGERPWIAKFNSKGLFKKMRWIQADEMADTELRFEVDIDGDGLIGPVPMPEPPLPEKPESPEIAPPPSSTPADTTRPNATISSDANRTTNGDVTFTISFTESGKWSDRRWHQHQQCHQRHVHKRGWPHLRAGGTPTANSSGIITVEVMGNTARDAAGNGNTAATSTPLPFDIEAPTLIISSPTIRSRLTTTMARSASRSQNLWKVLMQQM
jgi:hypothetical protein